MLLAETLPLSGPQFPNLKIEKKKCSFREVRTEYFYILGRKCLFNTKDYCYESNH